MRCFTVVLAGLLLIPSAVFAQRPSGAAPAPSSPTPSSPAPSPSISPPAMSHSAPMPSPAPSPAPSHVSSPPTMPSVNNSPASHPTPRSPEPDARRVLPDPRSPSVTVQQTKPAEPDLRHRICANGPCKEPEPPPVAKPVEPDLRRRLCVHGQCGECGPGQTGKDGTCVVKTPQPVAAAATPAQTCQPGQRWNGASCGSVCQPGESWNGASCSNLSECASLNGRSANLASELRGLLTQMRTACQQNPSGQECIALTQRHDGALLEYQVLFNGAPLSCRATLADPLSL